MAILKDQPRSTSAIASNRCVLLSLDRNEFLHLISYGNSNIDGSSIDEEDRRFNQIISKYIGESCHERLRGVCLLTIPDKQAI